MKNVEKVIGFIGIILLMILGKTLLASDVLFFRLLVGTGIGYTLSRAYTGFAGSVNRAVRTGSTKLMRTMMFMFFIAALLTTAFLFRQDATTYSLWINPINLGLILGGLLFGFGMSFASCCASGVMTDLVTGLPRAFITLIFFMMGVFLGYPLQNGAAWVKRSWFFLDVDKATYHNGIFLPDLFRGDGTGGYIGALLMTAILCGAVVWLATLYEKRRKLNNTYTGVGMEKKQAALAEPDAKDFKPLSNSTYDRLFVRPWTLQQGAVLLVIFYGLMMGVTRAGWGASTPYGIWFGKILMLFGVSADSLASFSGMSAGSFTQPLFQNQITVQNVGIVLGTAVFLLTAGVFKETFLEEIHITTREALTFVLGGLTMGFGTRLANGCNVGALFTPIANFSLSGWVFLVFMVVGGVIGHSLSKVIFAKR